MRARTMFAITVVALSVAAAAPTTRPTAAWKQTAAVPAPEAHQAAAADERFLYAIDNTKVAKYDRATGALVATSTGVDAKHLNSGFFHDGKLHCAHSNYPRTPESSQLMLLDPETMKLSVARDFGNCGGSLTWAVRHDGHWWLNFARYDERNGETFLVKFDDRWNELARFTYPRELIAQLGKWSLSGGLFLDGRLVVTGHDAGVLFRLRLPKDGTVLGLIDAQRIPFTGQGFAPDPATPGGLVGIHRGRKQIILAAPPP